MYMCIGIIYAHFNYNFSGEGSEVDGMKRFTFLGRICFDESEFQIKSFNINYGYGCALWALNTGNTQTLYTMYTSTIHTNIIHVNLSSSYKTAWDEI